ncbi:MAG TPA: phosphatidylglycerophosphatase A [Pyrinomonadaceae bacterium]|jgi:phosphatidylglycerophosphatase A
MPDYDELVNISATIEQQKLDAEAPPKKNFIDYFSLAVTTFGVGYLPLAPGTWGSMVGVAIYLGLRVFEISARIDTAAYGRTIEQTNGWIYAGNAAALLLFCLLGIWASSRATKLFKRKDPSQVVVDEVMGQLIVFLFVPFEISWTLIFAGFLLFRLFDIWKPYPIDSLENLPAGIGICADDILAGVYGGVCLSVLYALAHTWF